MSTEFKKRTKKGVGIITCPKRLDIQNSDDLKNMLGQFIANQVYRIVLDLGQTAYVDSSGLGAIVSTIATARANNGDIRLVSLADNIANLLEITHLNKVLKCYKSVEEGIKSFD